MKAYSFYKEVTDEYLVTVRAENLDKAIEEAKEVTDNEVTQEKVDNLEIYYGIYKSAEAIE